MYICLPFQIVKHSNLDHLESNLDISRRTDGDDTNQHCQAAEQLEAEIIPLLCRYNGTANRATSQSAKGLNRKGHADSCADLANVGDLSDECRCETDVSARGEAKDDGKDDNAGCVLDGDPDDETEEGGDEGDDDHDVVATHLVGNDSGDDASEDAHGVEDGEEVGDQLLRHACGLGLEEDVVEGEEHSPHEEEEADDGDGQAGLLEAGNVLLEDERLGLRGQSRLDRQARDGQEEEEQKGHGTHHPGEADLLDHLVHHDGQNHAAHRGARDHDAKGRGAALEEPRHERRHAGVEGGAGADGRDDGLGEEELVVVAGEGRHHQPEDVGNGAAAEEPLGAVAVEDAAEDGAAEDHEEELARHDPADGRAIVLPQRPGDVVPLEDAHAVEQAKGAEEGAPAAKDDEPGLGAAVREVGRRHARRRAPRCRCGLGRLLLLLLLLHVHVHVHAAAFQVGLDGIGRFRVDVGVRFLVLGGDAGDGAGA